MASVVLRDKKKILKLASTSSMDHRRDEHGRLKHWYEWAAAHRQRDRVVRVCRGRAEWEAYSTSSQMGRAAGDLNRTDNNNHDNNNDDNNNQNNNQNNNHERSLLLKLSIVSWNTLSDTWYEQGARSGTYDHTTPRDECGAWEGRFPLLLRWISSLKPDVLALQEVDYHRFESHALPELRAMGYDGLVQRGKKNKNKNKNKNGKQQQKQPCGVATFWWKEKLELLDYRMGSRSLATHFGFRACHSRKEQEQEDQERQRQRQRRQSATPKTQTQVCVINVHLECAHRSSQNGDTIPTNTNTNNNNNNNTNNNTQQQNDPAYPKTMRVGQLNSPLLWASERARVPPSSPRVAAVVVCGDFNAGAETSLLRVLRTERWHGHAFASVYEHPAAADTLPVKHVTTFAIPHRRHAIDHMLYTYTNANANANANANRNTHTNTHTNAHTHKSTHAHEPAILAALLDPLTEAEAEAHLLGDPEKGFPDALCPSDHLPIGAVFLVPDQQQLQLQSQLQSQSQSQSPLSAHAQQQTHTDEELEAVLESALWEMEEPLESYFAAAAAAAAARHGARDGRGTGVLRDLLLVLIDRVSAELVCGASSESHGGDDGEDGGEDGDGGDGKEGEDEECYRHRELVKKFVNKRIGKEYGRWKFRQQELQSELELQQRP
eukprot:jgi/Psemu1/22560/gm1.22560_g